MVLFNVYLTSANKCSLFYFDLFSFIRHFLIRMRLTCFVRSKKKVFRTALGERVQNWTNGLPDKVQHLKIGGRFGKVGDIHRSSSEVGLTPDL